MKILHRTAHTHQHHLPTRRCTIDCDIAARLDTGTFEDDISLARPLALNNLLRNLFRKALFQDLSPRRINQIRRRRKCPLCSILPKRKVQPRLINIRNNNKSTSHILVDGDLTEPDVPRKIISETISAFGRIDVLINNAGICAFTPAQSVTKEILNTHLDVNYTSSYLLNQAASTQMAAQGTGGSVVCISSITAVLGSRNLTHYASTKAALLGMSKSFAVEYGGYGIRYNCVLPGTIRTSMNERDLENGKAGTMEAWIPLGRLGVPDDLAGMVMFFASDLSRYVTGQEVLVDGGASIYYQ